MKEIPKNVHLIWVGGDIPDRNRACIATFPKVNPDWQINLWVDRDQLLTGLRRGIVAQHYKAKNTAKWQYPKGEDAPDPVVEPQQWDKSAAKLGGERGDEDTISYLTKKFGKSERQLRDIAFDNWVSIRMFCKENGLNLRTVEELTGKKMLGLYRSEMVARGTNFGAASDILRIQILNAYGGIYFDTDVNCTEPLGSLVCHESHPRFSAVHNLWVGKSTNAAPLSSQDWWSNNWWRDTVRDTPAISNSIIASNPKCKGLASYNKLITSNYKAMQSSDQLRDRYMTSIRNETIRMTGPTAATDSSGFGALRAATRDGKMPTEDELIYMRDNWYFPMYMVKDQYFHDWLK